MALTIVSRSAAGLPPVPSSIGHRSLASWTGIKVHHTGGAFSSWRAVHDWQTAGRPEGQRLAYIGYSWGVADGVVTELRGWDRAPAHDHENSTLAVVFGGNFQAGLPAAADLAAFVAFCRMARQKTGRRLEITGHRDTWPRGDRRYSTCPGDALYAHLPELRRRVDDEEDDVSWSEWLENRVWPPGSPSGRHMRADDRLVQTQGRAGQILTELAELRALVAVQAGQDVAEAVRAELDRHRPLMLAAVAERLDGMEDRLAAALPDLPPNVAEQVRAAVRAELAELRLVTEPAELDDTT